MRYWQLSILSFCIVFVIGCSSVEQVDPSAEKFIGREVWTATNLHVLDGQYIHWQNYLSAPIIPVGTALRIVSVDPEVVTVMDTNDTTYTMYWRGEGEHYGDVFEQEYHKYFTTKNPEKELLSLPQQEQEWISLGKLQRGMSKKTVLLARGWPINVADPEKEDLWIYWATTWQKQAVRFVDGAVVEVIYADTDG